MKHVFFLIAVFISTACFAQQKDSTAKNYIAGKLKTGSADSTIPKLTAEPVDSVYGFAIILSKEEAAGLVKLISSADEKPSVIKDWLNLLNSKAQILYNNKAVANKKQNVKPDKK